MSAIERPTCMRVKVQIHEILDGEGAYDVFFVGAKWALWLVDTATPQTKGTGIDLPYTTWKHLGTE